MNWRTTIRKAVDPVERSHFHIIWLLAQGKRVSEVALITDYCPNWIRILACRYNQDGPQVLADQRKQNTGAPALLSSGQKNQLRQLLEQAPPDGGLWAGPKVAHWMSEPESGETHWLLLPTVSIEVFAIALAHFARAVGAGPDRRIILVLDCAGWHSSQTLVISDGIHLVFLPPYSPELQRSRAPLAALQRGYRQSSLRDAG